MAGEALESSLIINDEASRVLEEIARQSDITADALANVENALRATETAGNVTLDLEVNTGIEELEREIRDTIDLSALEEANEHNEEAWADVLAEIEEQSNSILDEWEDAERGIVKIPEEATREAERTAKELAKGARGLGADIAGWWSVIKDVFHTIGEVFSKMAEEADKLNTRMARYGMVAESEGKTGEEKTARSRELYDRQQKFAQALGVGSEAFNETVLNMYSNGAGVLKSIEQAQAVAASSYMAMDIAGLRGRDKDAVMGEVQSMVSVGIADPDQIQEAMKIAPNILRTIEKQWQENQKGKAFRLNSGEEITDATGKIAVLAQEGQITAELVSQAMINSAQETKKQWEQLPNTWEKVGNRAKAIAERMCFEVMEAFGKLADDPMITNFIMEALKFGKLIVKFVKDYIAPVVGGVLRLIGGLLTGIMSTINTLFSSMATAIPTLIAIGTVMGALVVQSGLLAKAIAGVKAALTALSAHPLMAILIAVLALTFYLKNLVETNQDWQEGMLTATAHVAYGVQQLVAVFSNLWGVVKWIGSKIALFFMSIVNGVMWLVEKALEKLAYFSDGAEEALANVREWRADYEKKMGDVDDWGQAGIKELEEELAENTRFFEEYKKQIPDIAKENVEKNKNEMELKGYLDDILGQLENAPGKPQNPAHVKGKVAIDGEYFDIIRRAAGVEIVNRYTTLRPTVNARFGDIHQMDAQDVLGQLGRSIQDAEGAAISDAQAMGA